MAKAIDAIGMAPLGHMAGLTAPRVRDFTRCGPGRPRLPVGLERAVAVVMGLEIEAVAEAYTAWRRSRSFHLRERRRRQGLGPAFPARHEVDRWIHERNQSVVGIARATGISVSMLSKVLAGERRATQRVLGGLAMMLGRPSEEVAVALVSEGAKPIRRRSKLNELAAAAGYTATQIAKAGGFDPFMAVDVFSARVAEPDEAFLAFAAGALGLSRDRLKAIYVVAYKAECEKSRLRGVVQRAKFRRAG